MRANQECRATYARLLSILGAPGHPASPLPDDCAGQPGHRHIAYDWIGENTTMTHAMWAAEQGSTQEVRKEHG